MRNHVQFDKPIRELPEDMLIFAEFEFFGAPPEDRQADAVVIKDKQIALIFPVSREIRNVCHRMEYTPHLITPTDRDRVTHHIERCTDEEYIVGLAKAIQSDFRNNDFPVQVVDVWRQGYAYRKRKGAYCRQIAFEIPKENAEEGEYIVSRICRFRREQILLRNPMPKYQVSAGANAATFSLNDDT